MMLFKQWFKKVHIVSMCVRVCVCFTAAEHISHWEDGR